MRRSVFTLVLVVMMVSAVSLLIVACGGGGGGGGGSSAKLGITANYLADTVSFFNAESLEPLGTTDAGCTHPFEVAMAPNGAEAYVLCYGSPTVVSIVSMDKMSVIGTVGLSGDSAYDGVVAQDGYLYVAYDYSDFVSKVMVSGGTPSEIATISISGGGGPILETPDGNFLYVASHQGDNNISKIDIAAMAETGSWAPGYDYIYDIALDTDGRLYLGSYDEWEIPVWNTATDSIMGTPLPLGVPEVANGLALDGDKLYVSNGLSYNTGYNNGALSVVDTSLTWDDYNYDNADDSSYDVVLPFSFPFMGSTYDTITFSSNGVLGLDGDYGFDTGVQDILGFTPNNEDLDSGSDYFNYSHRVFPDHVVFQWSTATNGNDTSTSTVTVFEAVVYDDGRVRFDYLFSMPDAVSEDDGSEYGVGDGSGTALVNLRTANGSPFDLQRRSFLWDPATSTSSMQEVPFTWEGSGAVHLPLVNLPHGIAMTDDYIFLPCPKNGYESAESTNVVEVYNRSTMLPAGTITVDYGPRGIAIQP